MSLTGMDMPLAAGLAAIAAGGIAYVCLAPYITGERQAEQRRQSLAGGKAAAAERATGASRREQVAKSLKEVEAKKDKTKVTLELRLARAGLGWTRKNFYVFCAVSAVLFAAAAMLLTGEALAALGGLFAGGLGFPFWTLAFLRKRRVGKFVDALPDAIDVVVRGIRSGIPVGDCLRIVAREADEPLRSEFKAAVDAQNLGLSMSESILRMHERVPVTEVNFFAVVIAIQQKAGGNLSEALGNLSRVLRERKKMYSKVQAMSMEAKASGVIIALLPFIVATLTYFSSPDYVSLLWTTSTGKIALLASGFWMSIGIFSMKKMISFDI